MNPVSVEIGYNLDDSWRDMNSFLKAVVPLLSLAPGVGWTLDLTHCRYLGPDAAVVIAAIHHLASQRGQHPEIRLPKGPPPLVSFCEFVGLSHQIQKGPRPQPNNPQSETVPIRQFWSPIANAETPVVSLIDRHFTLDPDVQDSLGVAINEVIQNVADHAESPVGALMAARFFSNQHDVRVSIVDLGVGIPATLSRAYPEATDAVRALELVFQGERSSRSRQSNMGLGISNLVGQVRQRRGELILLSGAGVGLVGPGYTAQFHKVAYTFPGTAVFFRMRVDDKDL